MFTPKEMIPVINAAGDEIVDANPEACSALGYSRDELLSARLSKPWPDNTPALLSLVFSTTELRQAWTGGLSCATSRAGPSSLRHRLAPFASGEGPA